MMALRVQITLFDTDDKSKMAVVDSTSGIWPAHLGDDAQAARDLMSIATAHAETATASAMAGFREQLEQAANLAGAS